MADEFNDLTPEPSDALVLPDADEVTGGAPEPSLGDAPPISLRDQLTKARDELADKPADDRPRRADGTFAPKSDTPAAQPRAAAPATPPPTTGDAKPAPDASTAPAGPPTSFSPEAKAAFQAAPPALQQAIAKRESEIAAGFAKHQERSQRLDQYEAVMAPNRHIYAPLGVSDVQAVQNIWNWFHALSKPETQATAFAELYQMVGFDPQQVSRGAADSQPSTSATDPAFATELQRINSRVDQVATAFERQQQERTRQELATWAKDKPYFERPGIKPHMGRLMAVAAQQGAPITIDDAYQQATWGNAEIRAELLAAEKARAVTPPATVPPAQRVASAVRAAVSPRSGAPNGAGSNAPKASGSVREALMDAMG